jgi:ATP-dependent RNA helicase RhlE
MSFASLGLSEALVSAIEAAGYTQPTPVQQRAIPAVLQGRDLMVAAQTGTGKTGGFALPILERLFPNGHPDKSQRHGPRQPRVLVLTPTRELAAQVHDSFKIYAKNLKFVSTCIFGGVGMNPQVQAMARGVTSMRSGLCSSLPASAVMSWENVAEKSRFWRLDGRRARTFFTS